MLFIDIVAYITPYFIVTLSADKRRHAALRH